MRHKRAVLGSVLVLMAIPLAGGIWWWSSRPTINILLITLDTTRADRIGCYGYQPAQTPTLDELAAKGVRFERAYTPAPLTLPSHSSLMTGLYPPEHGLRTNGKGKLPTEIPTLAENLTKAGYDTGGFVASFVLNAKFGLNRGFAAYDDDMSGTDPTEHGLHRQRPGSRVVDLALNWLRQPRRKPFFCWVHLYDPHFPYVPHTDEFGDRFQKRPYDGELAYVDGQVKRLLAHLDSTGQRERTLIVVVGDHGEGLDEHGEHEHGVTLYNSVLHVPWIWSGPHVKSGGLIKQPVCLVDFWATLADTLGTSRPVQQSGRSLRKALQGGEISPGEYYGATDDPLLEHGWSPLRSLTTVQWKYIRTPDVELYDLLADPHETKNLASARPAQIKDCEQRLAALERRMTPREGAGVLLSPQEERALRSLGYLAGDAKELPAQGEPLPDVKRMLPRHNALNRVRDQLAAGKLAEGEQALRRLLAEDPKHLKPQFLLAEVLIAQSNYTDGQQLLNEIIKHHPDESDAWFQLGLIEAAQQRDAQAVPHFLKALQLKSDQIGAMYNLGLALTRLGKPNEAQSYLEEALEIDPAFVNAHIALGTAISVQGGVVEAIDHYRQALAYDSGAVEAHSNLAILLTGQNQMGEAGQHFAQAAKLAPDNPETRFNYGTFLLVTGQPQQAATEFEATLRLKPDHEQARQRLQGIRGK